MRWGLAAAALGAAAIGVAGAHGSRSGTPEFRGNVSRLPQGYRAHMTSWHKGCPVPRSRLRMVTTSYLGFDGVAHTGKLVVNANQARRILGVMHRLYDIRYPIRRIRLPEAYGSDDDRLGNHDVTSAFNCRFVGGTHTWSEHAYGRAIDVNPRENPYVAGSHVGPPSGKPFVDRSRHARGMIHAGDRVVRAFRRIGWGWGGKWTYPKDYMHFSATGR